MEYLEELWHTKQDGESDCRRLRGLRMRSY